MATDKVRLASIGLGWWGGVLVDAVNRGGSGEVVSGFARSEDARKAFSEKHGCRTAGSLDELLNDPEVEGVIVATPHSTHLDMISAAASAGKHVFVEKPLTLTVDEAKKAIEATSKANVTLQIGHHRRRLGANRKIREMIDSGELGVLHQLEANLSLPMGFEPKQGWRNDPAECPAGSMTGLGVHMIDNLQYLAGPAKKVAAFSKKVLGKTNLDDTTSIIIEYENGPLGYIGSTFVIPKICDTAAFGTKMRAYSEEEGGKLYVAKVGEEARSEVDVVGGDALADEMNEFCRCARGEATPETGGPEGLEVVAVLEAVVQSATTGQVVDVASLRG